MSTLKGDHAGGSSKSDGDGMSHASGWAFVLFGLASACARPATAQAIKSRGCHEPNISIGVLEASGTVRFQVAKDGKTASGSVAAVMANGASLAGLQSAAERQLSACRFDTRQVQTFPLTVEVQIRFDSLEAWFSDPRITLDQRAPEPVPIDSAPGAGPFPATLFLVDERPRQQGCQVTAMTPRFPVGSSVQDLMFTSSMTQNMRSGAALVRYEVKADGRVDKGSIEVLRANSGVVREHIIRTISKCRFAPARIGGMPVAVTATQLLWLD